MVRRPSLEPERTSAGDEAEGWNDIVVTSSECVEECVRRGAAGWRGSLNDVGHSFELSWEVDVERRLRRHTNRE